MRELAVDDVQIGAAHAAGFDADQKLAGPGRRARGLAQLEGPTGLGEDHGTHTREITAAARSGNPAATVDPRTGRWYRAPIREGREAIAFVVADG